MNFTLNQFVAAFYDGFHWLGINPYHYDPVTGAFVADPASRFDLNNPTKLEISGNNLVVTQGVAAPGTYSHDTYNMTAYDSVQLFSNGIVIGTGDTRHVPYMDTDIYQLGLYPIYVQFIGNYTLEIWYNGRDTVSNP